MQIPVSQADWPAAFNGFSKYLGKHWPKGSLKLNKASEVTAWLFGYSSVHDLQKQLVEEILIGKMHSTNEYERSMAFKAMTKFGVDPNSLVKVFKGLPWHRLSVWPHTTEGNQQKIIDQYKASGTPIFIDEFATYGGIKTEPLLVDLADINAIPLYEYAVNDSGLMYTRQKLEDLIKTLDISEENLRAEGFTCTRHEFILRYLLPLAWQPIADQVATKDSSGNIIKWHPPYPMKVIPLSDKGFKLFHEGYQRNYHKTFETAIELEQGLIALYLGKHIGLGVTGESVCINGDYFDKERDDDFSPYSIKATSNWLADQKWLDPSVRGWNDLHSMNNNIDPLALDLSIYRDHIEIGAWYESIKSERLRSVGSTVFVEILKHVYGQSRRTLENLQRKGMFVLQEYDTQEEMDEILSDHVENGVQIFEHMPELKPYFDEVAISDLYQDWAGNTRSYVLNCYERSPLFISYVIGHRTKTRNPKAELLIPRVFQGGFLTGERYWDGLTEKMILDVANGQLQLDAWYQAWVDGNNLIQQFHKQSEKIDSIAEWAQHINQDTEYLTHGVGVKLIRKSFNDHVSDMMKYSRKIGRAPTSIKQTLPDGYSINDIGKMAIEGVSSILESAQSVKGLLPAPDSNKS